VAGNGSFFLVGQRNIIHIGIKYDLLPFSPPSYFYVCSVYIMAPFYKHFLSSRAFDLNAPSAAFEAQWVSPGNYAFTVLLLLGGDIVSRALAQLAGGRFTPVAFSFGMSFL
jgi:hypothetical protein